MTQIPRRSPSVVMRLDRLGSMHQCRLSFMRQLTRRMAHEDWRITQDRFDIDDRGVGRAVYVAHGPDRCYALACFAHDLPADQRSDRVIANAWDATFTLCDGIPSEATLDRLEANVPLQEAGRISQSELTLSRANRSARLWDTVVEKLAAGVQPSAKILMDVGYLMRTTAVYGSGKFGSADRELIADRPEMAAPFQAEMLTVYLIRCFVRDLVNHMAQALGGPKAVKLDPKIAKTLGIGNSTGLGMAPFVINHPVLFNNWIAAREEAIARVRSQPAATQDQIDCLRRCLAATRTEAEHWHTSDAEQTSRIATLRSDLAILTDWVDQGAWTRPMPWDALMRDATEHLDAEAQELLASLILEPFPDLVDPLAETMSDTASQDFVFDAGMPVAAAMALLQRSFGWTKDIDWNDKSAIARLWYVSAEKLEPRLGERFDEPIEPYEQPLSPARDAAYALDILANCPPEQPLYAVLADHPKLRGTLQRAQLTGQSPYSEIQDNTISSQMRPIDMLRAKLSFFGATRFDPRSDRWLRISMFAGAPYPEELRVNGSDRWIYGRADL